MHKDFDLLSSLWFPDSHQNASFPEILWPRERNIIRIEKDKSQQLKIVEKKIGLNFLPQTKPTRERERENLMGISVTFKIPNLLEIIHIHFVEHVRLFSF
jgi:hypothetical protein